MDDVESYYCKIDKDIEKFKSYFSSGIIYDIPDVIFKDNKYIPLREYATFRMGFSVVTKKNCIELKKIIDNGKVLEVMCGLGSYSATLRNCGVDIKATDNMSWIDGNNKKYKDWKKNSWISNIENIDAVSAIKKYGKSIDYVLMSWPPQNEDDAYNVLITMRKVNPRCKLIYIGEGREGCTANNLFFDNINDISDKYSNIFELRNTFHSWENDGYYDKQYILC